MIILTKKDLRVFFSDPLFFAIAAAFTLVSGWIFFNLLVSFLEYSQQAQGQNLGASFIETVVLRFIASCNFLYLIIAPLFAMRLMSEEIKNKTLGHLLISPLREWEIVLSKFATGLALGAFLILLSLPFPIVLILSGLQEVSVLYSGYLALFLNYLCYLVVSLWVASLTENTLFAAFLGVLSCLSLSAISWFSMNTSNFYLMELLRFLGLNSHFELMLKGYIRSTDIFYYLSFIGFVLYLLKKKLQARFW